MKILVICSKTFYNRIEPIKQKLEEMGHSIELPNSYDNPGAEKEARKECFFEVKPPFQTWMLY